MKALLVVTVVMSSSAALAWGDIQPIGPGAGFYNAERSANAQELCYRFGRCEALRSLEHQQIMRTLRAQEAAREQRVKEWRARQSRWELCRQLSVPCD